MTALFRELLACPGVVEDVVLAGPVGILAFHGGALEEETDRIALEVADAAGASVYVVALPEDLRWHVPSRLVTAEGSVKLAAFLDHVHVAVALHGYGREGRWTSILLGGGNRVLAAHVGLALGGALPGYEIVTDLDEIPLELRGLHPDNPVNRVRGGGVQIELPPRVRGLGPRGTPEARMALVGGLVSAVGQSGRGGNAGALSGDDASDARPPRRDAPGGTGPRGDRRPPDERRDR